VEVSRRRRPRWTDWRADMIALAALLASLLALVALWFASHGGFG